MNIDIESLINKNNPLDKDYIPKDMILINHKYAQDDKYMVRDAVKSFENMVKDALLCNHKIIAISTYRSYEYQEKLYNYYVKTRGKKYASTCSAKPGYSEHQTGLAVDVEGSNGDYNKFDQSKEFEWMKDNCFKYGFILRYPKGKEKITGYKYEPWHYRYVGYYLAKHLYDNNLVLEEYKGTD